MLDHLVVKMRPGGRVPPASRGRWAREAEACRGKFSEGVVWDGGWVCSLAGALGVVGVVLFSVGCVVCDVGGGAGVLWWVEGVGLVCRPLGNLGRVLVWARVFGALLVLIAGRCVACWSGARAGWWCFQCQSGQFPGRLSTSYESVRVFRRAGSPPAFLEPFTV